MKEKHPLVSVIIPNYNHERFLEQRIESVVNQIFENFEVIIFDDCSTDNSKEIIEKYRNNPYVSNIIYNDVNSGSTFRQWKKGIEIARGEYIWIAESDDWCEPTFIQTIFSAISVDKSISLGFAQSLCLNEDESIRFISKTNKLEKVCDGNYLIINELIHNNIIVNASMAIFRRDIALSITDEFMDYKYCGDWLFWINISQNNKVFISGKVLNYFRKHSLDVSTKFIKSGNNYIEQLKLIKFIYTKKIIDYKNYKKSVKKMYLLFLVNFTQYDKRNKYSLNSMFIETKVVNYYYFVYYLLLIYVKNNLIRIKNIFFNN